MGKATLLENAYYKWLKEELIFSDIEDGYVSISSPFVDTNFDNINLYAKFLNEDNIEVSDFGYTIFNLEEAGVHLDKRSKVAWRIYNTALADFGITREGDSLLIRTSLDNFAIAKNRLIRAIMRINDISYLSKGNVKEAFNDLIESFLIKEKVLYTPNVEIPNENGASSHFDFSIPSRTGVERLIKTSARPNDPNYAKVFNYDVKATAPSRNAKFIYVLNNVTHKTTINQNIVGTALNGLKPNLAEVAGFSEIEKDNTLLVNS